MADLGELLGTILTSLVHARRIADEETAAVAESYKDHPLLEGMAIPRIRLPEVTLDMPVVIDSYEDPEYGVAANPDHVREEMLSAYDKAVEAVGAQPSPDLRGVYERGLETGISRYFDTSTSEGRRPTSEMLVRASEDAYARAVRAVGDDYFRKVKRDDDQEIRDHLREAAKQVALEREGAPPRLHTTFVTTDVKERADNQNVARLRLVIKEEGVEWSTSRNEDGSMRRNLAPE